MGKANLKSIIKILKKKRKKRAVIFQFLNCLFTEIKIEIKNIKTSQVILYNEMHRLRLQEVLKKEIGLMNFSLKNLEECIKLDLKHKRKQKK